MIPMFVLLAVAFVISVYGMFRLIAIAWRDILTPIRTIIHERDSRREAEHQRLIEAIDKMHRMEVIMGDVYRDPPSSIEAASLSVWRLQPSTMIIQQWQPN